MKQNKYLAITIGPIVETLMSASTTGELWANSYFFSYTMGKIAKRLREKTDLVKVLLPFIDDSDSNNAYGAGLYPDRIYMKVLTDEDIHKKVWELIQEEIQKISGFVSKRKSDFLQSFLNISLLEKQIGAEENIILELSKICDAAELNNRVMPSISLDKRYSFDRDSTNGKEIHVFRDFLGKVNDSCLKKKAFGEKKERFESILEISTKSFSEKDGYTATLAKTLYSDLEEDEQAFISELKKKYPGAFKAHHKYMAVVHADGDNVGKIINEVGKDPCKIRIFSGVLLNYAKKASQIIAKYGGLPVYMGGDDMLFFAPICNETSKLKEVKDLFQLIEALDNAFDAVKKYAEKVDAKITPSLSYGVSIAYYRTPLYEVRADSYQRMDYVKKNIDAKNAVNVSLLKHSGRGIEFLLQKNEKESQLNELHLFNEFLESISKSSIKDVFLASFMHKLDTLKPFFEQIFHDRSRLTAFFEHNFNENFASNYDFFDALIELILKLFGQANCSKKDGKEYKTSIEERFKLLYAILRYSHFIASDDKE